MQLLIETQFAQGQTTVLSTTAVGVIRDLYDFSFAAPGLASVAGPVQVGHGVGRDGGRIYLNEFEYRKLWFGMPAWEDCP